MLVHMLLLQRGSTPLHFASMNGNVELVKLLIHNQADISATNIVSDYVVHSYVYNCYNLVGGRIYNNIR